MSIKNQLPGYPRSGLKAIHGEEEEKVRVNNCNSTTGGTRKPPGLRITEIPVLLKGLCSKSISKSILKLVYLPLVRFSSFVKFAVPKALFV